MVEVVSRGQGGGDGRGDEVGGGGACGEGSRMVKVVKFLRRRRRRNL